MIKNKRIKGLVTALIASLGFIAVITYTLSKENLYLPALLTGAMAKTESSAPRIISAKISPAKVKPGDMLLVTVEIEDQYGIKEIVAGMPYEQGTDKLILHLAQGDNKKGKWEATWQVHDTVEQKWYTTTVNAVNSRGMAASAEIKWQDPSVSHPASQISSGTFGTDTGGGNYSFPADVSATGYTKGNTGLCIGNDCRTSWPRAAGTLGSCYWQGWVNDCTVGINAQTGMCDSITFPCAANYVQTGIHESCAYGWPVNCWVDRVYCCALQ